MSAGPTTLYLLAGALRDAIALQYTADSVSLPDRRYVTGVEPVGECDALAVAYGRVYRGIPGSLSQPEPVRHSFNRAATLRVYLWRCLTAVPSGDGQELLYAPSVADLEADAAVLLTDAYTLHRAVVRAHYAGQFGDFTTALEVGEATPLPVSGGIGGTLLVLDADLS